MHQTANRFVLLHQAVANVIIQARPTAIDCASEQWLAMPGETGISGALPIIHCAIRALPPPTIHWRFRGQSLSSGERYVISSAGLGVVNPTIADAGLYTVIARQPKNTAVFDIRVRVFR